MATPALPPHVRTALALVLLVAVRWAGDIARLFANPTAFTDGEEGYNAAVALALGDAGLWDQILVLQYRAFCGGCTVVSVAGAPLLAAFGDAWLAWKSVALLWGALTMLASFFAVDRWAGRPAAWFVVVLLAVPIPGLRDLSLTLWGNHQESTLFVLISVALVRSHPGTAGFFAGFAVWFCRIGAYGLVVVPLGLVVHRWPGRARLAVGLVLGLAWFLVPAGQDDYSDYALRNDDLVPQLSPARVVARLGSLFGGVSAFLPGARSGLIPFVLVSIVIAVAAAMLIVAAVRGSQGERRAAVLLLFPAAFAAGWAVAPFATLPGGGLLSARYHAPWWLWSTVVAATAAGVLWGRGRRWLAVALVAALPATGVWALVFRPGHRVPDATSPLAKHAAEPELFLHIASGRIASDRLARASAADPRMAEALRRMQGVSLGLEVRVGKVQPVDALARATAAGPVTLDGFGTGLVDLSWDAEAVGAANRWLDRLDPEVAGPFGSGLARGVASLLLEHDRGGQGRGRGGRRGRDDTPAWSVDDVRDLVGAGASDTCWLCEAQGIVAVAACRGAIAEPRCLAPFLDGAADRHRVLRGMGAGAGSSFEAAGLVERVRAAWGEEAAATLDEGRGRPFSQNPVALRFPPQPGVRTLP